MSFPIVETSSSGGNTTATTSHLVTLPSGIVSGNLLLIFIGLSATGAAITTPPTGWTVLFNDFDFNALTSYGIYRVADGTEGTTVTITSPDTAQSGYNAYRISGMTVDVPQVNSKALGLGSTTANPAALSPSWGISDTLWFAVALYSGSSSPPTVSTFPTGYSGGLDNGSTTAGANYGRCASAYKQSTASSENPGVFTFNTTAGSTAYTVAVRGVSGIVVRGRLPLLSCGT